jgi:hypothetical protein
MKTIELYGAEKAAKTLQNNLTPRYIELDQLQAYVEGRQYAGKPHWLTENDTPLLERAPCIVEPVAESAIESYVDLVFGEGRFPEITSHVDEDGTPFDARFGLSEDDSAKLDKLIQQIKRQAEVEEVSREALGRAMGERSTLGIVCVRDGKLAVDLERAKCAAPTFDASRPSVVLSVEIRYPYLETYFDGENKRWALRCMLFRRVIDQKTDTVFKPIIADENGEDPGVGAWKPQTVVEHRFGFCPVVWYAYRKIESSERGFDGIAIHERLLDEIDALNRSLSQKHRAGLVCGDPQIVEIGVDPDHNPAPSGRPAEPMRSFPNESPQTKALNSQWRTAGTGAAGMGRRKGAGVVWRYTSKDSKVEYLTLEGDALEVLDNESKSLRNTIAEAMSWVRSDPMSINGDGKRGVSLSGISGKALAWMYKRQTTQCDTVRPDVFNGWILPLVDTLLRVALAYAREPSRGALYLPGMQELASLLDRFEQDVATSDGVTAKQWFRPALSPQWPPYFQPTEEDQARVSTQVIGDKEAGLITLHTAVSRIKDFYPDIDNVEDYIKSLQDEAQKRADDAHKKALELKAATPAQFGQPGGAEQGANENEGAT